MPTIFDQISDPYIRRARLLPALLALAAPAVAAVLLIPASTLALRAPIGAFLWALAASPLAGATRDAGRDVERRFRSLAGGRTSAIMLLHSDERIRLGTKARYHAALRTFGLGVPSADEEKADRAKAIETFEAAIDYLLSHRPPMDSGTFEEKENIEYGFRRNVLGMKRFALQLAILTIFICVVIWSIIPESWLSELSAITFSSAMTAYFFFIVKTSWVLRRDEDYAIKLLSTCENLPDPKNNS